MDILNFPNPSHIFLTGCSAGGTVVPVAYDIINKHYNTLLKGGRSVNINSIMDSSVYLTPSYFLTNGFPNWNPNSIMKKKLGFNYNKYQYDERYPDMVWHHVLKRGSSKDSWGFVTHSSDPISLMFYQYMSGNGDNNGRSLISPRRMDNNDLSSQWWTEINASMQLAMKNHHNVDTYVIDGEGHCSFGLYYPLQESNFETWASPIVKEKMVIGNRSPSFASFFISMLLGGLLIFLTRRLNNRGSKEGSLIEDDHANSSRLDETFATTAKRLQLGSVLQKIEKVTHPILTKVKSCPWTAGYMLATSIYFFSLLISQGFTHPLDNPSFGPSAVGLSIFGINNPALIIYKNEHFRLITSSFLHSGVTTFLLLAYTLYKTRLESQMTEINHPHWHFPLVGCLLSFTINLIYGCIGNGASCGSLALALGLNAFSITLPSSDSYPSPWCFTTIVYIFASSPIFPFDSVVALSTSIISGILLGLVLFFDTSSTTSDDLDVYHKESRCRKSTRWIVVYGIVGVNLLVYLFIIFRIPTPDVHNIYPYLTGCNLVYSDQVGDIVNSFSGGGESRKLEENGDDMFDGDRICAQMCIPHIVYRPALWGINRFDSLPILEKGACEENGYESHIADKTFNEYSFSLEVQIFTSSSNEDNRR